MLISELYVLQELAEPKCCTAGDHAVSHRRRIAAKVLNEHPPDAHAI